MSGYNSTSRWPCQALRWLIFEFRSRGWLCRPIANANEFQHGSGASIAQPRFGQPHDARVTAGAIDKSWGNDLEADLGRLFIA